MVARSDVRRLVQQDSAQLVEVLPREEYEEEHIAGAISLPLKDVGSHAAQTLDRSRPVIVYCNDFQ
jgi:rhodanese-related sulfurtransferase